MTEPPSKADREQCWNSRDMFWKCLDLNKDDQSKCKAERSRYESSCSKTWVQHFDRRREYLKFKAQMAAGGDFKENLKQGKSL